MLESGPRGYWTIIQSRAPVEERRRRSEIVRDGVEDRQGPHPDLGLQDRQVARAGRLSRRVSELVARPHGGPEVRELEIDAAAECVEVGLAERRSGRVRDR